MARYDSILDTIGDTPLIRLHRMAPDHVNVYVKTESFNPMSSVKDRMALAMIEAAEESGELKPGQTVIEATSGNTGIGLAMVCARKGYPLVVTMAENFSVERRKLLRFLGAKVVLTPASEKGSGMLNKAVELAEEHGYFLCRQFENPANSEVHRTETAIEILRDFDGESVDYFVTGFGTGGTLKGISQALREHSPPTRIIATEPDNSPVLGSGIPQARDENGSPTGSHPNFRPHLMQGWSPDFISPLTEDAVSEQLIDEIVPVAGDDAMRCSRELAQREGIFVGTSSGATLAGALEIAKKAPDGSNIVCMLPDTGERYLSTPLFADIGEDMGEEELSLSNSTPGYRFSNQTAPVPLSAPANIDGKAVEFVNKTVANQKVVMFALEWCEFCWSVRKLFNAIDVEFTSIDLDSVRFQEDSFGTRIREVLNDKLGVNTIPQIYIDGHHIGGCTELFDAYKTGEIQSRLVQAGIVYNMSKTIDPYAFLPTWLHTRGAA